MTTDSLAKTSAKLNALQEKVDSHKVWPGSVRIMALLLLILAFVAIFILIFLLFRKLDMLRNSQQELDKKTNERFDLETIGLRAEIKGCRDLIINISNEMDQRVTAGLNACEVKGLQAEAQMKDYMKSTDSRIDNIVPEVTKIGEELSIRLKTAEGKLHAIKQEADQNNQVMTVHVANLEESFRLLKGKQ